MIRSDRQLTITQRKLSEAEDAYEHAGDADKALWRDLVSDLRCEIDEYQAIRAGVVRAFDLTGLDDLPDALVKARLARRWTHRQLADELRVSEQNVQRDEARSYENAAWTRLADIIDALGYRLHGRLEPVDGSPQIFDATAAALAPTVPMTGFQHFAGTPFHQFKPYSGVSQ